MIFLYILSFIVLIIGIQLFRRWRLNNRQRKEFRKVFTQTEFKLPTIKIGSHYAWTTFEITFSSKVDYDIAERKGLFQLFNDRIKEFYDSKFDPERAVYYTYIGHIPTWAQTIRVKKSDE